MTDESVPDEAPLSAGLYWVKFQWLARDPNMQPWWSPGAYNPPAGAGTIGVWIVLGQNGLFHDGHPAILEVGKPIQMPEEYQREILEKGWQG